MTDDIAELTAGIAAGLDPQPAADVAVGGTAVTHLESSWNHRLCTVCGQTFRRGDSVSIDPGSGVVTHLDPALGCASDGPVSDRAADVAEFADGLLGAWPPVGDVDVVRLRRGDRQVARPDRGPSPPTCLYCGHTFRAGEQVVICPCGRHRTFCMAAVHRDPVAGLTCWDDWRPDGRLTHCPITLTKLEADGG